MEIPEINIPKIDIQKIKVPVYNPYQVLNVPLPSLKLPGCVRYHRDVSQKILPYIMMTQKVLPFRVLMVLCLHLNLYYMTEEK